MRDEGVGAPELVHIAIGCFDSYMKSAKLIQLGGRARLKNRCMGYNSGGISPSFPREQAAPGY